MTLSPTTLSALAFVTYAGASLAWSPDSGLLGGAMLASLAGCYLIGQALSDLRKVWMTYCLFLAANVLLIGVTYEGLDFRWGIFGNPNYFGAAFAIGLAGAVAYELWPFVALNAFGLLYTESRSAMMGAAAVGLAALWRWSRAAALGAALLAVVAAFAVSGNRENSTLARIGIWNDTVNNMTVFGSGFGSFDSAYSAFAVHKSPTEHMTGVRAPHVYNDFLELTFELGIGVVSLWLLTALALEINRPDRLVVLAYLAISLTFFPLWVPLIGQLVALSLGHLARHRSVRGLNQGASYEISTRHSSLPGR